MTHYETELTFFNIKIEEDLCILLKCLEMGFYSGGIYRSGGGGGGGGVINQGERQEGGVQGIVRMEGETQAEKVRDREMTRLDPLPSPGCGGR